MVKSQDYHSRNHKKIFKYEERRGNFDRRRGNGHQNHDHHSHHDGSRSSKGVALLTHRNVPDSRRTNSDKKNDSSLVNRLDLPKNISPSILDFFHRIGQRLRNRHRSGDLPIDTNNNDDLTLWKQSWAAAAVGAGDMEQLSFITQALLRLPDSANVTPPCEEIIAILQRIVMCTLDDVKKSSRRSDSNSVQFAISNLECIIDIIRDRLTSKMSTILDPQTIIETGVLVGGYEKIIEKKKRVQTLFIFEMIREISSNLPTKTQVSLQYRDFCGEEIYNLYEI